MRATKRAEEKAFLPLRSYDARKDMAEGTPVTRLLCISCRKAGHLVSQCPDIFQGDEYGWFFSPARRDFVPSPPLLESPCERCLALNLAALLEEDNSEKAFWKFKSSTPEARIDDQTQWRRLGPVSSLVLDEACPICRCLYSCSPSPTNTEQELWVFAFHTICRLAAPFGENAVNPVRGTGARQYARYLTLVLWPPRNLDEVDEMVQRGDGLCMVVEEDDVKEGEDSHASANKNERTKGFALAARRLPQPSYSPRMLENWISRCSKLHPSTCQPVWTPGLSHISLLDVRSRRVVHHPGIACDYLALSYVWGSTPQATVQIDTTVSSLPQTIEDAITVTLALGKQYLWVDSICIDQSSPTHKAEQISRMCDIYRGAYCTLVALSSTSATSGLARVNPAVPTFAQLSCSIPSSKEREVEIATIGLTLSQTVWVTKWGTRAWTFQEALLSPRNIYFSDHQIIFECNAMTCCESLNETNSHGHNLFWDDAFIINEKPEQTYGLGVLRNPFVGESRRKERMKEWSNLLVLFMYRSMTDSRDSLNAFDGVLKALQDELYPGGFHWGIPKEQFNLGLLWLSRGGMKRREGFPSWSWCGWQGPLWGPGTLGFVDGVAKENENIQPRVKVVTIINGELVTVFDNSAFSEKPSAEVASLFPSKTLGADSPVDPSTLFKLNSEKRPGLLCVTAPILKLRGTASIIPPSSGESRWVRFKANEVIFIIEFTYCMEGFEDYLGQDLVDWLVLARENPGGASGEWCLLHLLGVVPEGEERGQRDEALDADKEDGGRSGEGVKQRIMTRLGSARMWIRRTEQEAVKRFELDVRSILLA
ncbi:hypothetical protein HJFPF1_13225 [Paramyrothecium foliicola]|nr:hypothetical protein HJFPF1_13225 [Paramyrothecium foliicola]